MNVISMIYYYVTMIMVVVMFALVVTIGVLFYFLKIKKVAAKVENIDTSRFKREDSISYASFKDVVSRDGAFDTDGMIVIDDNTFVGGISVRGFDYPAASSDEKIDAQINSVQFFNVVEKPTSFRQSVRAVDLSANIEEHKEIAKKLSLELLDIEAEHKETLEMSENYLDDPQAYAPYNKRLTELKRMHFAKSHMLEETKTLIEYMSNMSGDAGRRETAIGQKNNQIMFSYIYNPDEYSQDLSKGEIYLKAMDELSAIASSYGEALAACHFGAKRLTARELIGLMRKHTSPITGEDFDLDELLDSSYTALFVSCDSLVEACKNKIAEDEYFRQVEEYQARVEQMLKEQEKERERRAAALKEESFRQAYEELAAEGGNSNV